MRGYMYGYVQPEIAVDEAHDRVPIIAFNPLYVSTSCTVVCF